MGICLKILLGLVARRPLEATFKMFTTVVRQLTKKIADISSALLLFSYVVTLTIDIFIYRNIIVRLNNRAVSKKQAEKTRNTVARMLITNGILFFSCLGPMQLVHDLLDFVESTTSYRVLDNNQYQALLQFSRCLLLLNSIINPYVLMHPYVLIPMC